MKNLKKFTSLMMAMVMSVSCMAFTASAVEATDDAEATQQNSAVKVSGDVAHIEDYMEFYNNQDYYIGWAVRTAIPFPSMFPMNIWKWRNNEFLAMTTQVKS